MPSNNYCRYFIISLPFDADSCFIVSLSLSASSFTGDWFLNQMACCSQRSCFSLLAASCTDHYHQCLDNAMMDSHFDAVIVSSTYFLLTFISLVTSCCFFDYRVDDIFLCFPGFIKLARYQVCIGEPGIVAQPRKLISSWLAIAEDSAHSYLYSQNLHVLHRSSDRYFVYSSHQSYYEPLSSLDSIFSLYFA